MIFQILNLSPPLQESSLMDFSSAAKRREIGGIMEESRSSDSNTLERMLEALPTMENNERVFYSAVIAMGLENSEIMKRKTRIMESVIKKLNAKKVLRR